MSAEADQVTPASGAEVEQRASEMGWFPKEQFRGDPAQWVDAAEYVRRGENIMPILRANNQRQSTEIHSLRQQLTQAQATLQASQEAIAELKAFNAQVAVDKAKAQKISLMNQIAEAKRAGDVEREVQLTDQLGQVNAAIQEPPTARQPVPQPQPQPQPNANTDPVFLGWRQENPWYGADLRKTALAGAIATELRQNPQFAGLPQRQFLDAVSQEVDRSLGGNQRRNGASRVEGAAPSGQGGGASSGGRSYADLPTDAREACDRQGKRLIGPGRAFKNDSEWRAHYVAHYDWS